MIRDVPLSNHLTNYSPPKNQGSKQNKMINPTHGFPISVVLDEIVTFTGQVYKI